MRYLESASRRLLGWLTISAIPAIWLEGVRLLAGAPFSWAGLAIRWAFVSALLFASRWTQPYATSDSDLVWPWPGLLAIGIGVGAALLYIVQGTTWTAWIVLGILYLLLLGLERGLTSRGSTFWRWGVRGLLVLLGGVIPVAIVQIESHFADEEFFVALQALVMAIFCALLLLAQRLLSRKEPTPIRHGLRLNRRWTGLSLFLLVLIGLGTFVRAYQHSFYPTEAPVPKGISAETPFLCGEVPPDPKIYDGKEVFRQLLAQVAANPYAGPPEYGMLALGTGEQQWALAFRETLLNEAQQGRFTGPAYTVKSVQQEAALRAYYLPRVQSAFPDLFSSDDLTLLREWFAAINHQAHTVEPVDWLYALAFAKPPEGPYENQENGAGLLALLEAEGLAATDLSPANRDYLERNQRGWIARFRNTDDALVYQLGWIYNAYFQSLYTGGAPEGNVRLSFEWLMRQALADGAPLRYNHPVYPSLAGIAYLGARLLNDPRYVWLAGRALEYAEAQGTPVVAQPGAEHWLTVPGRSPTEGSCLLYGGSGLPNQLGPLAPDKIVFRDGWSKEAAYLLLNLRFTGWHRYKATNTITLLYQGEPLAGDVLDGEAFRWLPVGRSLFRDKRIPRENLNGLLIPRTKMSAVLYQLTSIGGPWAQDPPYYAKVVAFETGDGLDWSHTRLEDWRGWQHDRWIYFYHDGGPIVVVDKAEASHSGRAAVAWHLFGGETVADQPITLRSGDQPVEVLFLGLDEDKGRLEITRETGDVIGQRAIYHAQGRGQLRLLTLFLPGDWAGAEAELDSKNQTLRITQGQAQVTLEIPFGE